jgi:hypothetical protein
VRGAPARGKGAGIDAAKAGMTGAAAGLLLLAGCGGGGGGKPAAVRDPLAWARAPLLFRATGLPRDRVLLGTVRNRSGRAVHLVSSRIAVHDAAGRRLRAWGQYVAGYAHGLYGAYQKPHPLPPGELRRLGLEIDLGPGRTAPLAVAYRLLRSTRGPLRVDYGAGTLSVPARARSQTG